MTKIRTISERLVRATGLDILEAVGYRLSAANPSHGWYRSELVLDRAQNPRLIDRGAPPELVLAVGGAIAQNLVTRHLAGWRPTDHDMSDFTQAQAAGEARSVAEAALDQCQRAVLWGLRPEPIGVAIREGRDPAGRRVSWFEELKPPVVPPPMITVSEARMMMCGLRLATPGLDFGEMYDRAQRWVAAEDEVPVFVVISSMADLVAFFAGLTPNPEVTLEELTTSFLAEGPPPTGDAEILPFTHPEEEK